MDELINGLPRALEADVRSGDIAQGGYHGLDCPIQRAMDRKYDAKANVGPKAMFMRGADGNTVWYDLHPDTIDWLSYYDGKNPNGEQSAKPFVARATYSPLFTQWAGRRNLADGGIHKLT